MEFKYNFKNSIIDLLTPRIRKIEKNATNPIPPNKYLRIKPEGMTVGLCSKNRKYICIDDRQDLMCLVTGGTGSGKSSSILIPMLITNSKSANGTPAFVVDIKQELYDVVGSKQNNVKVLNIENKSSYGFNPYWNITKANYKLCIPILVNILIPDAKGKEEFWNQSAKNLLNGLLIGLYEKGYGFIESIDIILSKPTKKLVEELIDENEGLKVYLGKIESLNSDTLTSIEATLSCRILIFSTDENVRNCLSKPKLQCINPIDLVNGISLYIQIPEYQLESLKYFIQMLIGNFIKTFESLPLTNVPRATMFLDELFRLGYLESLMNATATLRGRGLRIVAVTQSFSQLQQVYGEHASASMADNFNYKILLSANNPSTQEFYSKLIGHYKKQKKTNSYKENIFSIDIGSSVTCSEEEKRIVPPEALAYLGNDAIFIFPEGWCRFRKTPWYNTPALFQLLGTE